jgi:hypothetical protein
MIIACSVPDPDPNPDPDPHVFGPPGSGSTSQRFGSGSGTLHAKRVRKLDSHCFGTFLGLFIIEK